MYFCCFNVCRYICFVYSRNYLCFLTTLFKIKCICDKCVIVEYFHHFYNCMLFAIFPIPLNNNLTVGLAFHILSTNPWAVLKQLTGCKIGCLSNEKINITCNILLLYQPYLLNLVGFSSCFCLKLRFLLFQEISNFGIFDEIFIMQNKNISYFIKALVIKFFLICIKQKFL